MKPLCLLPVLRFLLLAIVFIQLSPTAFSQYEIKESEEGFIFYKNGKKQRAEVLKYEYFEVNDRDNVYYRVKTKKKEALVYQLPNNGEWLVNWFDEVLELSDQVISEIPSFGLIMVRIKDQFGLFSYVQNERLFN